MPHVVVDTSQWIQYFRMAGSSEAAEVRRLLTAGDVVMVGIVYAEVLRGARDEMQFNMLKGQLGALPFAEVTKETWRRAGCLLADLKWQGLTISLADAVIAALALQHGFSVFTRDEHFRRVPGLALHTV